MYCVERTQRLNMIINQRFKSNEKGRDFFIGDLHGGYEPLIRILKKLQFSTLTDRVFSVGDLIDRGQDSEKCLSLLDEKWFFSVLGNHEKLLLEINSSKQYQSEFWYQNGGKWWQYIDNELRNKYFNLASKLPLSISVETNFGNIGIVHADYPFDSWPPPEDCQNYIKQILWGRNDINSENNINISNIRFIISGHTPLESPKINGNRIFIDTGEGYYPNNNIKDPKLTLCEFSEDFMHIYNYRNFKLTHSKIKLDC